VRPHIIRGTAVITVILATGTTATTRATTALAGEATIGLGGDIGTTAGTMADGTGGADAAGTVVTGTVVAGMATDGTAIIDSESQPPISRVFRDGAHARPVRGTGHGAIRCDIATKTHATKFELRTSESEIFPNEP
jgi:hypothetical protein